MIAWVAAALVLFGAGLMAVAAIGVVRMPDLFTRMQAAAKAGTLGVSCLIAAVALHFGELGVGTRAALVILFLFATAPVAAHAIARAAYTVGVPLWDRTAYDALADGPGAAPDAPATLPADGPPGDVDRGEAGGAP